MVGTILKMIASPNINQNPHDESKALPRGSPIQASIDKVDNETSQHMNSDYKEDGMPIRIRQNGGTEDQTVATYEDDDIDGDVTDGNSGAFQCSCKVWSCTQCQKAFSSARALKIHEVKQHENVPKRYIKCTHCDEVFDHSNLLQIHMKVHHNIKVQCSQCKDVPKPNNSKVHQAEPMCPVCGVKFDHDKLLKLHMEHYHKVSRKESVPTEQQTFQSVSTLLSPNSKTQDSRTLSPDSRKQTPSPRQMEGRFSRSYYDTNSDDSNSRSSVSPREVHGDRELGDRKEMFDQRLNSGLYSPRHLLTVPRNAYYFPVSPDNGALPYGLMGYYPQGVRRSIEKRPLGRSHSLPLKQETVYPDVPLMPWQMPDTGYPVMYGMPPREKKLDRAALEAMRNSLKAKLRSVEETLLREETESHQPLSPTLHDLYDNQRYFRGREEDVVYHHRPSVITPRSSFGAVPFKRQAPPSDLEPTEKIRAIDQANDNSRSPSRSPSRPVASFSPLARESVIPRIYEPRDVPRVSRDDLAIPNLQREYFDNQAKIFIKRGAPRCNRCQQTFCSKMEYLHHLISHREKDGLVDASPEEMEFIEDVKRSMDNKNFAVKEVIDNRYTATSTNTSESPSPDDKSSVEAREKDADAKQESSSEDKSCAVSPSASTSLPAGTECIECKDVFVDSASYQSHVEKRHMKPRCRECGLTFDHKNLLKIHMDCYHSSVEVLQCYYCGMSFKHRVAFLDHVTSHESQDISNKERVNEQSSDTSEQGGRRRWGRLVASAQLPAEKSDGRDGDHAGVDDRLEVRDVLALRSHTKQKLRKTVSLSAYTDMINRQKRSHAQFLHETRSKGDEAIGKEMRTRIFLPNFEDKMENLSRFASSSVQLAKKRVSPPPQEKTIQGNGDYMFRRHNVPPSGKEVERPSYHGEARTAYTTNDGKPFPYVQKRKLERLKRSAPVEEDIKAARLSVPLRKAFVRDEVENLYQMRHKKAYHSAELPNSPVSDPIDHRNALVKIERVEVDPGSRNTATHEPDASNIEERKHSSTLQQHTAGISDSGDTTVTSGNNSTTKVVQPTVSTVAPPPLIDVRRSTQASTVTSTTESNTSSSRHESPCVSPNSFDSKTKLDASSSTSLTGEWSDKEVKGKRRNSIKRLTKEALINSLSLKRRSSAPDLYQFHREQSNENMQDEKTKNTVKHDTSPGSPSTGSERTASPSIDTKHHGSRSLYYTPRKQSDRDVTCVQCGVSFGHKKLYKIHLDSYHGKQAEHECLQCGARNFQNKDEFVKHLMAHQNEGKASDVLTYQETSTEKELDFHQTMNNDVNYELNPKIRKLKASLSERGELTSSDEEKSHFSPQAPSSEQSNDNVKVNNNAKETIDKKTTCQLCGKVFENGKQLEQHFSSHAMISEDGRFCCVICNKPFETLRKLEVHSRSHTGFKPHKCEQCGRCFPYYSSYYYHKMTHTKDRPHKCPVCGKGFIQTRYLRSHLATHKDEQGSMSDEVESIIRKAELTMNDETDEESIDSPGTAEGSPGYRANDEETATAEILCSFKRGLNCSAQNSDSEQSPALPLSCTSVDD